MGGKRVLVISPHCDDESFGCGGTILKHRDAGDEVHLLIMSVGDVGFEHLGMEVVPAQTRVEEARDVAEAYGASVKFGMMGWDMKLDALPLKDLIKLIEERQDEVKADVWYIPGQSFHQDHRRVFEAAVAACRPTRKLLPREVYRYELPTYSWNVREHLMVPNVFEDIGKYIDKKIEICSLYRSQVRGEGMLSLEQIREWAKIRGFESRCKYAEAFEVVRIIR